MNQNDSKDPRELELEIERLKLELEKTKFEPNETKNKTEIRSSEYNYIPANLSTIAYLLAFLPPVGIILVWIDPKIHIILKLFSTCFGLLSLVVLIGAFRLFLLPLL